VPTRNLSEPDAQTKGMIQNVQDAASLIDIQKVPYILNSMKVENLARELQYLKGPKRTDYLFDYGIELLNAGKTEQSIKALKEALASIQSFNTTSVKDKIFLVKKQLAIARIRKAEQDNCLVNHTNKSCIIPISGKAQHILKEGSEQAIILLNELLIHNPNDYECQYLLNIAHMTLGQYPEKVPNNFRIPEAYFKSSANFPHFSDIVHNLGLARSVYC
jgi:tetratricopeptide (TPR) repeat protein